MRRALTFGCASLLVLALALVGFWAWDARRTEHEAMHYLASAGGVPPTYQDVQAFLEQQFPAGMDRAQVLATLDERFTWSFLRDQDTLDDSYDRIAFPRMRRVVERTCFATPTALLSSMISSTIKDS